MNAPFLIVIFHIPPMAGIKSSRRANTRIAPRASIQVIDEEAMKSIVEQFNQDAAAGKLRHGNEMLIDHEHFSDQPDKETRAYGWLMELQIARGWNLRPRALEQDRHRKRWTAGTTGFSPRNTRPKDCVECRGTSERGEDTDGRGRTERKTGTRFIPRHSTRSSARVRPLRLDGLTLTNMNNNRGQKPITNRDPKLEAAGNRNQRKENT